MTSKNLFFKLQIEDLKRRLGSIIVMFLTFFISLPIFCTLSMESTIKGTFWVSEIMSKEDLLLHQRNEILYENAHYVSFGNIAIVLASIVGAIVIGLGGFSYLHSRKKVDFYHSAPIRRELHFLVRYVNGILIFLVPYVINLLLTFVIFAVRGYINSTVIASAMVALLLSSLHFLIFYSVAILAVMLTGQIVISAVAALILYTAAPLLKGVIQGLMSRFFITYFSDTVSWTTIFSSTRWVSAFSLFITNLRLYEREYPRNYEKYTYEMLPISTVFGILLSVILMSAFALYLYKKRSLEKAGQAMVFRLAESIFKFLVVVIVGFLGGYIFNSFNESLSWYLFGTLLFFVLASCIIEMIYHFDVRKAFAHKVEFLCFFGFTTIVALSLYKDWFGYDTYLPKQDKIESVSISFQGEPNIDQYFYDYTDGLRYRNKTSFQLENTKIKNTDLVYPLLQNAIMDIRKWKGTIGKWYGKIGKWKENIGDEEYYNYYNYYNITELPFSFTAVSVKYTLKNGREVFRKYHVVKELNEELMNSILTSEEYYKNAYSFYQIPEEILKGMSYLSGDSEYPLTLTLEEQKELMYLYGEDVGGAGFTGFSASDFVGVLCVRLEDNKYSSDYYYEYYGESTSYLSSEDDNITVMSFPIFHSFTNTIAFLTEHGCDTTGKLKIEEIASLKIVARGEEMIYDEPDDIEKLLPFLYDTNYTQFQRDFSGREIYIDHEWITVSVEIEFKDAKENQNNTGIYFFSTIPESIKEEIIKRSKDM